MTEVNSRLVQELNTITLEAQEKQKIVQRELKIAEPMYGSATWLQSLNTQISKMPESLVMKISIFKCFISSR